MNDKKIIRPDMTVLDIVSKFRITEKIFKQWDRTAGECICCNCLFEPLDSVAAKYNFDLENFISELETAIERE